MPVGRRAVPRAGSKTAAVTLQSPVNFAEKLAQFDDHWAPRVIAEALTARSDVWI